MKNPVNLPGFSVLGNETLVGKCLINFNQLGSRSKNPILNKTYQVFISNHQFSLDGRFVGVGSDSEVVGSGASSIDS
jgi:hypothetical protein